jgi:ParB/RepB/Spo0J family partition protein
MPLTKAGKANLEKEAQTALALAPENPPDLRMEQVPIANLVFRSEPKPGPALRDSVRNWTVLQPLLVHEAPNGNLAVVDGNRRALAARDVQLTVPCLITSDLGYLKHVASMMLNNTREKNLIQEMESIDALLEKGATAEEIAKATGTPTNTIKKRMRLRNLDPSIQALVKEGKVASGVAEQIAKLSKTEQGMLLDGVKERDPDKTHRSVISEDDVKAVRSAASQQAALSIDPSLFDDPPTLGGATGFDRFAMDVEVFVDAVKRQEKTQAEVIAAVKKAWKGTG